MYALEGPLRDGMLMEELLRLLEGLEDGWMEVEVELITVGVFTHKLGVLNSEFSESSRLVNFKRYLTKLG